MLALTALALAACGATRSGGDSGVASQTLVYVTDGDIAGSTAQSYITALDAASGKIVWRTETAPSFGQPIVSGGVVYVASTVLPPCCGGGTQSGELSALDALSGQVRWREKMAPVPSAPILSAGTLYLTETDGAGNRSLAAINASDGKTRWRNTNEDGVRAVVGDVVYAERHSGGGTKLSGGDIAALRASDGTPLWTTLVPFPFATIGVTEGKVVIWIQDVSASVPHTITQRLRVYGATTGGQLWAVADSGQSQLYQSLVTNGTLYATESTGVTALRMADGAQLWRTPSARAFLLESDASALYAIGESGVVALNRSDGHQLWTAPGRAGIVGNGIVYLIHDTPQSASGQETLSALDARTGMSHWSVTIPSLLPIEYPPLPVGMGYQPNTVLNGDTLYLVVRANGRESSLLAVAVGSGALRWQYQPSGGVGTLAV